MRTATAAVLSANHEPFVLEKVEIDSPIRGEVLVRIVATGLCHTDLSVREGLIPFPLPGVLGHEGAGIVEEVGDGVTDLEAGHHVVMSFAFCGQCRTCRTGRPVYCESWAGLNLFGGARADGSPTIHRNGDALHGHFFGQSSLSTRALAPASSVVKVARNAPLEILGSHAACRPARSPCSTSCARTRDRRSRSSAPAVSASAPSSRPSTSPVPPSPSSMSTPRGSRPGSAPPTSSTRARATRSTLSRGSPEAVASIARWRRPASRPCSARPSTSSPPRGICGIVGAPAPDADVSMNILTAIVKGSSVVGINQGDAVPRESIPALVELHRQGRFPFDELIRVYPFEDIQQAADDAAAGTVVKPVLRMPGATT